MSATTTSTLPSGRPVVWHGEIDSTNSEAMRRASAGQTGPLWIVAERQRAGRGRSGRRWTSEPGNLFASLLLQLDCAPALAAQLSLVAGLALHETVAGLTVTPFKDGCLVLKWPNDVLLQGAKFSGILIETQRIGRTLAAVIGIGVNLVSHPDEPGRATTALARHGIHTDPQSCLAALDVALFARLADWNCGAGFAAIREAWLARSVGRGEPLSVNTGQGPVSGLFSGLDCNGALLIATASGTKTVTFGDVMLARERTPPRLGD
jgi:BirA family biotin operon repressor/biotin-[acetyl-CoA-carboxylase] ligase